MTVPRRALRIPQTHRAGVVLAVATALISGVSIWLNASAVRQVPDAAVYTTLKNGVAAALLLGIVIALVPRGSIRAVSPRSWGLLALVGVIGGSVPFLLFFIGLAQASAPSAAVIHKTLFVWVALLAVPLLRERLGLVQVGALAILLAAQALILNPSGLAWGTGETLIAIATLLWAVETILARRLLAGMPSAVAAAGRLGFGLVVLIAYLAATGRLGVVTTLGVTEWAWVLATGVLLSGYVATWFAALQRAPASLVTAILVLGAPVTAALQAISTGALPAMPALGGQLLILVGAAALAAPALAGRRRVAGRSALPAGHA